MSNWYPGGSEFDEHVGYLCAHCKTLIPKGKETIINIMHVGKRCICEDCNKKYDAIFSDKEDEDGETDF